MIPIKQLRKRPYNKYIDAQKLLSYSRLTSPVQAKVRLLLHVALCHVPCFALLNYCNGEAQNEDFVFLFYLFQNPADMYEQCANTNEDERELLKCTADICCMLLEKAKRVYALGDYRYHSTVGMVCVNRRVPNHTGQTKRTAPVQRF
jgi:hypothetical protein